MLLSCNRQGPSQSEIGPGTQGYPSDGVRQEAGSISLFRIEINYECGYVGATDLVYKCPWIES